MTRVKFIGRIGIDGDLAIWKRQIFGGSTIGDLEFVFDLQETNYDWLVVYDDLPRWIDRRRQYFREPLRCDQRNTILITSEPSSVRRYPRLYLDQFNYVISSQETEFIDHPGHIYTQCGLRWFYGISSQGLQPIEDIAAYPPLNKTRDISAVVSSKAQRHTMHAQRVRFIEALGQALPEIDRFGHGIRSLDDKAESLDPYRYHIAIENHLSPHHWTEKVSDSFLGCTLMFYIGAPNLDQYFPLDSFIPLNIKDPKGSAELIRSAIAAGEWEKRKNAILEARRLVLERYGLFQNLFQIFHETIPKMPSHNFVNATDVMESAYDARMRRPISSFIEKLRGAVRFLPQR